jgi:Dynamin family
MVRLMRTPLTDFSEHFQLAVQLVQGPLSNLDARLRAGLDEELDRELAPELRQLGGELEALRGKVEEQRVQVMIFGPLKSGKSTLMNALAGAFVSEVTSLPAYPAVVFVGHGELPSFRIQRYDGSREEVADAEGLRALIHEAHAELAAALRNADRSGRNADLQTDLPRAIRRIDISLPAATDLAAAEAVLVDTPGLYTRMRIGYDSLTRHSKRVASVAVFVVRADSLFLEQVFGEFAELLELYGRIFLVVNIDSRRMDLSPTGELVPSLEQSAPERIVRAFEELTMSARLKQAFDDGQLSIYPVDLLRAASLRLRKDQDGREEAADFERLRADLSAHLNGDDYLNAFISDALTRGGMLLDQLEGACSRPALRHFIARLGSHSVERHRYQGLIDDLGALGASPWRGELECGPRAIMQLSRRRDELVNEFLPARVTAALEAWFTSSASLQELIEQGLVPLGTEVRQRLRAGLLEDLRQRVSQGGEELLANDDLRRRAERCGVELLVIARDAYRTVERRALPQMSERAPLAPSQIPVRRRPLDLLLMRSRAKIRRRLFGPDDKPNAQVAPERKARLLGSGARRAMQEAIAAAQTRAVDDHLVTLDRDLREAFGTAFEEKLRAALAARETELAPRLADLARAVEQGREFMHAVEHLRLEIAAARGALQTIRDTSAPRIGELELIPSPPRRAPHGAPGEVAAQRRV